MSETIPALDSDSDRDVDWEEVPVQQHLEITFNAPQKQATPTKKRNSSYAKRITRINCHKIHTVCLLANAWVRNHSINDPLLHARLVSLTPLTLQNAFSLIHKSRVPDQNQRGRLFEAAITHLTEWWAQSFFRVNSYGHIINKTFDDIQDKIDGLSLDDLLVALESDEDTEVIRSSKSLMKHALMQSGSRDTSAQLFTALCRALHIPTRLVVSLQSVPWQANVGKPKTSFSRKKNDVPVVVSNGKGKERAIVEDESSEEEIPVEERSSREGSFPGIGRRLDDENPTAKGKGKAKLTITLRKSRSKGQRLGSSSTPRGLLPADPTLTPPVFWTEVFSRPDARWFPVDPIRGITNKRKVFDPSPSGYSTAFAATRQENRMVYVVAFEEDGYARDVTPRYAKEYGAKVAKAQEAGERVRGGGKGRKEWWDRVISIVRRPYRLVRDDLEDDEFQANQLKEGMPTSMAGFKNHPLYALSRHLRHDEVIHPPIELGKFRGEPVYPRSSVLALKSAENWMRKGRVIRAGCQPMKLVKMRAATVGRRREIELAEDMRRASGAGAGDESSGRGGGDEVMQGMYSADQTDLYIPEPIVDGNIPRNSFGNIDLYVPSMLPKGAVHVPYKGAVKVARKLGFSYAEAVTGFEFRKRRALPVIQGVVIAAENEQVLLEAFWEAEQDAEEKARAKRQERVIKRWTHLVHGLRIRQRLQEQYAGGSGSGVPEDGIVEEDRDQAKDAEDLPLAGGYLVEADDVVQPFHLPKPQYPRPQSSTPIAARVENNNYMEEDEEARVPMITMDEFEMLDDDQDFPTEWDSLPLQAHTNGVPKTMRQMAEETARMRAADDPVGPLTDSGKQESQRSGTRGSRVGDTSGEKKTSMMNKKATPRASRGGSSRKRRREEGSSPSQSQDEVSLVKKGRRSHGEVATAVAPPTRVLRPRAPKSAARLEEEKAREEAYRKAIAE